MNEIALYMHGGSRNHGCEAIVRGTINIIVSNLALYSFKPDEDKLYGVDQIVEIKEKDKVEGYFIRDILSRILIKLTNNDSRRYLYQFRHMFRDKPQVAFSIGGDNYCGYGNEKMLITLNKELNKSGIITVLWGCSVEPESLKRQEIVDDMKRYSLITARESITFNALIESGITKSTKLYPDPAFTLDIIKLELPFNFIANQTIGINMSPLIQHLEQDESITYKNYRELIKYIINETDYNVALIPHVVWDHNNDLLPLTQLYNEFKDTGRILCIQDCNCMELKGYISCCRMFIGARTHSTIAAYSTCVPTLVVGYSVKAKGIAKDIFGTYENYVLPVQSLRKEHDLINAFKWLSNHENKIRKHLLDFMPTYIEKAWQAGDEIKKLIGDMKRD